MLLWFPLKHLNNLICSSFDAFQVFCQNPLLVRTSLLWFSQAAKEEKEHGQIKGTASVKQKRKKEMNQIDNSMALSYSSDQSALNSFVHDSIELLW